MTAEGRSISVGRLSPRITRSVEKIMKDRPDAETATLKEAVEALEKRMIREALESCRGNRTLAAKSLGLSRQGLLNKIYKFGLGRN